LKDVEWNMAERDPQRAEEMIGRTLRDKWRVDALLGAGGMATVYAATHRNGMRGAIKLLHPHLSQDGDLRARLVREGYVANRVKHPGVVRVLDDDVTDDGMAFIVMELLDGEPWKARWLSAGRALPVAAILDVSEQVLEILRAAHEAGVLHRDVKPDNVFITTTGDVKLVDFGIARLREGNVEKTQTGAMLGTPAFMSPEQTLAHWDEVDARSDLFSLGASMWLMASGRLVHTCSTMPELLVAAATRPAQPFVEVFPDATPELAEVIDRAVAFDADARWQTAGEMLEAVHRARAALDSPRRAVAPKPRPRELQGTPTIATTPAESATPAAPAEPPTTSETPPQGPAPTDTLTATPTVTTAARPRSFGSGLAFGGAVAAALATALGIYVFATRPPAPPINSTSPKTAGDSAGTPGSESPVAEPKNATPEVPPPSSSAPAQRPSAQRVADPARKTQRNYSAEEGRIALERAAADASTGCAHTTDVPITFSVSGRFMPTGSFIVESVSPPGIPGSCVMNFMQQAHVTAFDGTPQSAGRGVLVQPR
jgi:serine/threonine protein kinase